MHKTENYYQMSNKGSEPSTSVSRPISSGGLTNFSDSSKNDTIVAGLAGSSIGRKALIDMAGSQLRQAQSRPSTAASACEFEISQGRLQDTNFADAKKRAYRLELDEQIRVKRELTQSSSSMKASNTPKEQRNTPESRGLQLRRSTAPYALSDPSATQFVCSPSGAGDVARFIKTMHWGAREIEQWREEEEKRRTYREELARQVEEKRTRTAGSVQGNTPPTVRKNPADLWRFEDTTGPLQQPEFCQAEAVGSLQEIGMCSAKIRRSRFSSHSDLEGGQWDGKRDGRE